MMKLRFGAEGRRVGEVTAELGKGSEVVEYGYFLGGQGEAEDVDVLLDALGAGGLGDDDDAGVDVPSQDDLGRADVVLGGDLAQRAVAQPGALERAVALECHVALA